QLQGHQPTSSHFAQLQPGRRGYQQMRSTGRGSPIPPPGSAVCHLLFKHSSCLSTTLALRGWRYL
ncbi:unnamed protein product, partial [Bubo scandiacus]